MPKDHTRMADRERERKKKTQHHAEQEEEEEPRQSELQIVVRMILEENKRAEAMRESDSKKAEARQIAAEERAGVRRREEKIADEERIEARRVATEERAEARRLAEERERKQAEAEREEAARVASRILVEQKRAADGKVHDQQLELMRVQAEIGEAALKAHREEQVVEKRKDKAVASIPTLKSEEDFEEFLLMVEKRLEAGGVGQNDWVSIVACKLSGKLASVWQDVSATEERYEEVKSKVLKVCSHTPEMAAELYYGFKLENVKGLTADQMYYRGQQLFRRMVAPFRLEKGADFAVLRGWVSSVVPKKARIALDSRKVENAAKLVDALQDYLMLEGGRTEGQAAVFGKEQEVEGRREKWLVCFKCGKQGHKSFECGAEETNGSVPTGGFSSGNPRKITCFLCAVEGHKSPQCPNRIVKAEPKEVPRKINRLRGHPERDTFLEMKVNGQKVSVLLDSGSAVTVVPAAMVAPAQLTGEKVVLRGFAAKEDLVLPLAEIPFEVDGARWEELVALAPAEADEEVVFGLNLLTTRGLELVYLANKIKMEKDKEEEEEEEEEVVEEEEEEEEVEREPEIIYRLRKLSVVDCFTDSSASGMVGGDRRQLEASQLPKSVRNCDFNFLCVSNLEERRQPEQPRTAAISFVGGDVGTAHRRRERERDKEKEEDKEGFRTKNIM